MFIGLGLGLRTPGNASNGAFRLLNGESDGLAIDFRDMSMVIRDTATPANNFSGDPNTKLTYASPASKSIFGANGLYSSATTLRTEYNSSASPFGVRVETAATNLLLRSSQFDNASWTKGGVTASGNAAVAPDGTTTADLLTEDTSTGDHRTFQGSVSVTNGTTYSFSVFVKPNGRNLVQLYWADGANVASVVFNTSTGQVTETTDGTGYIQAAGNGWYRCTVVKAAGTTTAVNVQIRFVSSGIITSYTGDGVSGMYLWGAQFEAGLAASTPIDTAGSTVARGADNITLATSLFPYDDAGPGTLLVRFSQVSPSFNSGTIAAALRQQAGGNANLISLGSGGSTTSRPRGQIFAASASQVDSSPTVAAYARNTPLNAAIAWDTNDVLVVGDGATATDTSATIPSSIDILEIGSRDTAFQLNGHIQLLAYVPRRMTEGQIASFFLI
jgi:hypothetical protein